MFLAPESARIIAAQSDADDGDVAYYEEGPKGDKVSPIMPPGCELFSESPIYRKHNKAPKQPNQRPK